MDTAEAVVGELVAALRGWQPIETAPKDGTVVLAYLPHCGTGKKIAVIHWANPGDMIPEWRGAYGHLYDEPTHWMSLPPAPAALPAGTADASGGAPWRSIEPSTLCPNCVAVILRTESECPHCHWQPPAAPSAALAQFTPPFRAEIGGSNSVDGVEVDYWSVFDFAGRTVACDCGETPDVADALAYVLNHSAAATGGEGEVEPDGLTRQESLAWEQDTVTQFYARKLLRRLAATRAENTRWHQQWDALNEAMGRDDDTAQALAYAAGQRIVALEAERDRIAAETKAACASRLRMIRVAAHPTYDEVRTAIDDVIYEFERWSPPPAPGEQPAVLNRPTAPPGTTTAAATGGDDRLAVASLHVPCTNEQHDPANGLIAGLCVRCRTMWPCQWSPEADATGGEGEVERLRAELAALRASVEGSMQVLSEGRARAVEEARAETKAACAAELLEIIGERGQPVVSLGVTVLDYFVEQLRRLADSWSPPPASGEGTTCPDHGYVMPCPLHGTGGGAVALHAAALAVETPTVADAPAPAAGVPPYYVAESAPGVWWLIQGPPNRHLAMSYERETVDMLAAALNRPTAPQGCGCKAVVLAESAYWRGQNEHAAGALMSVAARLPAPAQNGDADA